MDGVLKIANKELLWSQWLSMWYFKDILLKIAAFLPFKIFCLNLICFLCEKTSRLSLITSETETGKLFPRHRRTSDLRRRRHVWGLTLKMLAAGAAHHEQHQQQNLNLKKKILRLLVDGKRGGNAAGQSSFRNTWTYITIQ